MDEDLFKETKGYMFQYARDINNEALWKAISYCKTLSDLKITIGQAHGVGSEGFQKSFKYVLNMSYEENSI